MNRGRLKTIKGRSRFKPLTSADITDTLGEDHFRSTMAVLGWATFQASRQSDNRKIDLICRYEHALIEVQLKSKDYNEESKNWSWGDLFEEKEESYMRFYDQRHTFLCLVGVNVKNIYDGPYHQKVIEGEFPQIALIPGRDLIEYFKAKGTKSISIVLEKLKTESHELSKYFGEENIHKILIKEWDDQEKENKILDDMVNKKEA